MECSICHKILERAGLCQRCHSRIHRQLDDLLEYWNSAHDELLPGKSGNGGRSSERTIGLNVNALSFIAGDDILNLLHGWERIIREDRNLVRPAFLKRLSLVDELHEAVKFAQTHLEWSGGQEWFSDFVEELGELHTKGMVAAKAFVHKARRIACPAEIAEGGNCGNLLKMNEDDPLAIFECRKCQSQWTTLRIVAVALSDPNREVWLDAEAIAGYVQMTARNVAQFARRNNIRRRGELYDFKQLLAERQ